MKRIIFASSILLALGTVSCDRDLFSPDLSLPTDFVISNPALGPTSLSSARGTASIFTPDERIVYVSLPPHTLPDGKIVQIEDPTSGELIESIAPINGGFDPVPVEAAGGDQLRLTIVDPTGATVTRTTRVPVRRPPTIVRSDPRKGRTDIALSVSLTVVFSEPVDASTVSRTSMYLLRDGNQVSGSVILASNALTAKFVPDRPLDAQASYELVVTPAVHDFDGDALEGSYSAKFVTGTLQQSPCPGYADPAECPPFATGGSGVISGVVSERTPEGLRKLSGATVFAWVDFGNGTGYSRGGTKADADGKFTVDLLPGATILLQGAAAGYDQPCATVVAFNGVSATANIELVSQSRPIPEAATKPPVIQGMVYETTPAGRQPIAGARIFIDQSEDLISATTTTDTNGRYAVCRIPRVGGGRQTVYAAKTGYQTSAETVFVFGVMKLQLDIELKR